MHGGGVHRVDLLAVFRARRHRLVGNRVVRLGVGSDQRASGTGSRGIERSAGGALMKPLRVHGDVSERPTVVFGSRSLMWWATLGFMVIEGWTLALLVASYLYFRQN